MALTTGNDVRHAYLSRNAFEELADKDEDTIYFVNDDVRMQLYKGAVLVGVESACTSFYVYASGAIAAGDTDAVIGYATVAIPAQMTCKFFVRTYTAKNQSDIVVDWGDGAHTVAAVDTLEYTEELEQDTEWAFIFAHTYATAGKYKVKVYGKDYYHISNWTEYLENYNGDKDCNLLCECFTDDCSISPQLKNMSSFARQGLRLTSVNVSDMSFFNLENLALMFEGCENLLSFTGIATYMPSVRSCEQMFWKCYAMTSCGFMLPSTFKYASCCAQTFAYCTSLASDISTLIPPAGFAPPYVDLTNTFYGCASLTGTVPANLLWESNTDFLATNCFSGTPLAGQVPEAWGGVTDNTPDDVDGAVLNIRLHDSPSDATGKSVQVIQYSQVPISFYTDEQGVRCASFNHAALLVPAPAGGDLDFNGASFSICYWAKLASAATEWTSVVNKRLGGGAADYYAGFNYGVPDFYNGTVATSTTTAIVQEWHFYCYVTNHTAGTTTLYIDGVAKDTFNLTCVASDRPYLMVGACCYSADPTQASWGNLEETFEGSLHDVRVYPMALSVAEIGIIMKATAAQPTPMVAVTRTGSTNDSQLLLRGKAYKLDLSAYTGTLTLNCERSFGHVLMWGVDITLGASGSVQYGAMFNANGSDALTASKVNRCVVRWDGTEARLFCYATEDPA